MWSSEYLARRATSFESILDGLGVGGRFLLLNAVGDVLAVFYLDTPAGVLLDNSIAFRGVPKTATVEIDGMVASALLVDAVSEATVDLAVGSNPGLTPVVLDNGFGGISLLAGSTLVLNTLSVNFGGTAAADELYGHLSVQAEAEVEAVEEVVAESVFRDANSYAVLNEKGPVVTDEDAVQNMMLNLFRCQTGTRQRRPTFGCNLPRYLHEPCDDITAGRILNDLHESVISWLPMIRLDMARCSVLPNDNRNGFVVTMAYSIPALKQSGTLSFNAARS